MENTAERQLMGTFKDLLKDSKELKELKAFENELKAINLMVANEGDKTLQMAEKVNQTMDAYKSQLSDFEDLKAKQRQMSMMFEQMKIDEG